MSRFRVSQMGRRSRAKRELRQRLLREQMGEEAYKKMVAENDDRAFKVFGALFVVLLAVLVFGVTALGY